MRNTFRGAAVLVAMAFAPSLAAAPATQYFKQPGSTKPFSHAVRVGNLVFISGAVGALPDGTYSNDFAVQATGAMDKVAAELKMAGATLDDVYKCTIALTDMNDWDAFNAVYAKYFKPDRLPVRMALGVVSVGGARVEVQCEAALTK